jgi:hypothetical protein
MSGEVEVGEAFDEPPLGLLLIFDPPLCHNLLGCHPQQRTERLLVDRGAHGDVEDFEDFKVNEPGSPGPVHKHISRA